MATIKYYAGENNDIEELGSGFGLGFYGVSEFGSSVVIGEYQGRTFITDSAGTTEGSECDNLKFSNLTGVVIGQTGTVQALNTIPNYLATVNIRFEHDTAVKTQNVKLKFANNTGGTTPVSGATVYVYEVSHLSTIQSGIGSGGPGTPTISGGHAWTGFTPSTTGYMSMTASPGISGTRVSGSNTYDTRHDWYLAISGTPSALSSILNYMYVELEYLV